MRYGGTSATQLSQRLATQSEALAGDHIGSFDEGAGGRAAGGGGAGAGVGSRPTSTYLPATLELTARPFARPAGIRPPPPTSAAPLTLGADPAPTATPSPLRQPRRRLRSAPRTRPPSPAGFSATPAQEASAALPFTSATPPPAGAAGAADPTLSSAGPVMEAVAPPAGEAVGSPVIAISPTLSLVSPPRGQRRMLASAPVGGTRLGKRRAAAGPVAAAEAAPPATRHVTGPALVATAPSPGRPRTRASSAGGPAPSNWPRRRPRQQRLEFLPVSEDAPASLDEEQGAGQAGRQRKRPRRSSSPPLPRRSLSLARRGMDAGRGDEDGSDVVSVATSDGADGSASSVDDALTAAAGDKARAAEEEGVGDEDDFAEAVLGSGRRVAEAARRARLGLPSRSSSPALSGDRSSGSSASSVSSAASRSTGGTSSSSGLVRLSRRRLVLEVSSDSDASSGG